MPELSTDEVSTDDLEGFDFSSLYFYESMPGTTSGDAYELCRKALSDCDADIVFDMRHPKGSRLPMQESQP